VSITILHDKNPSKKEKKKIADIEEAITNFTNLAALE
jgi:hypothetical protein